MQCLLSGGGEPGRGAEAILEVPGHDEVPLEVDVVHRRSLMGGRVVLGSRFLALDDQRYRTVRSVISEVAPSSRRDLTALATQPGSLTLDDPRSIAKLLAYHGLRRASGLTVCEGGLALGEIVSVLEVRGDAIVIECPPRPLQQGRFGFSFLCGRALAYFDAVVREIDGDRMVLALPELLHIGSFRRSPRARLTAGELVVESSLGRYPAADLSFDGLAMWLPDPTIPQAEIGTRFELTIRDRSATLHALARLRSFEAQRDGNLCGFEIEGFAGRVETDAWRDFVFERVNPDVRIGARSGVDQAWKLLERSNYLGLWTDDAVRNRLERRFASDCTSAAGTANQIVVLAEDMPVGMVQATLVHPGTWICHQLCVDATDRKRVRDSIRHNRRIYSALCDTMRSFVGVRHFVVFAEKNKRWSDLLYKDFFDRRGGRNQSFRDFTPCRLPLESEPPAPAAGVEIVPANDAALDLLAAAAAEQFTREECVAFAFERDALTMRDFEAACAETGYQRGRCIVVAEKDGVPAAALLADHGSEGVNVFGLLNTCRIIGFHGKDVEPAVADALLGHAVRFYRERDKPLALYMDFGAVEAKTLEIGIEAVDDGMCWVCSGDEIPAWAAHVDDVFASRIG